MRILASALFALVALYSQAQTFPYELQVLQGTYQDLQDPELITTLPDWDTFDTTIVCPFVFELFGFPQTYIGFSEPDALLYTDDLTAQLMSAFDGDFCNADTANLVSHVGYVVEGPVGSRIFKAEWFNVALALEKDLFQTANNRMNFQIWIYEGSNVLEFRYGAFTIVNPELVNEIGVLTTFLANSYMNGSTVSNDLWLLTGSAQNPEIVWLSLDTVDPSQIIALEPPTEGLIYRFVPIVVNVPDTQASAWKVWPTATNDVLNLSFCKEGKHQVCIRDYAGRIVEETTLMNSFGTLNVAHLANGVYFIQSTTDGVSVTAKFMKN